MSTPVADTPWCDGQINPVDVTDSFPTLSVKYTNTEEPLDVASSYQFQIIKDGGDFSSPTWDSGKIACSVAEGSRKLVAYNCGALDGTKYFQRWKLWDSGDLASAWSDGTDYWIMSDGMFAEAINLQCEGLVNPSDVSDQFPDLSAEYKNAPAQYDIAEAVQVQVIKDGGDFSSPWWDSNYRLCSVLEGSRKEIEYVGTALPFDGTKYFQRWRFWDSGGVVGHWSNGADYWIMLNTTEIDAINLQCEGLVNPTGVIDEKPELSAEYHNIVAGDVASSYQVQVIKEGGSFASPLWSSGKTACSVAEGLRKEIEYDGTALPLDISKYFQRWKFWDNSDVEGDWSDGTDFWVMSGDAVAINIQCESQINPSGVLDTKPELSAEYHNIIPTDVASNYQIQVIKEGGNFTSPLWDSGKTACSVTEGLRKEVEYGGAVLPLDGSKYFQRWKFWDSVDVSGGWSSGIDFWIMSGGPEAINIQCESQTNPSDVLDTKPELSSEYHNLTPGDIASAYQIQVIKEGGSFASPLWDSGKTSCSIVEGLRKEVEYGDIALLLDGSKYFQRWRFWDSNNNEGSWSDGADFWIMRVTDTPAALNIKCESLTNPSNVTDTLPELSAEYDNAVSGDEASAYQVQVIKEGGSFASPLWDSTKTICSVSEGSRKEVEYGGTALLRDESKYFQRWKFWSNADLESSWSDGTDFWIMAGPPDTPSVLDIRCESEVDPTDIEIAKPKLSAEYDNLITSDVASAYQIQVIKEGGNFAVPLWNSAKVICSVAEGSRKEVEYGGSALLFDGAKYFQRWKFWSNGNVASSWSDGTDFWVMANLPDLPVALNIFCENQTNPSEVSDTKPELSAEHRNATPGDEASAYQVQVIKEGGSFASPLWNSGKTVSSIPDGSRKEIEYGGIALALDGLKYHQRWKFWSSNNVEGPWSDGFVFWIMTGIADAPAVLNVKCEDRINPSDIDDTKPELSAEYYNAVTGSTANYYQVQVIEEVGEGFDSPLWDSGKLSCSVLEGSRKEIEYGGLELLPNGLRYYQRWKFWSNGGIESSWSSGTDFWIMFGAPEDWRIIGLKLQNSAFKTRIEVITP